VPNQILVNHTHDGRATETIPMSLQNVVFSHWETPHVSSEECGCRPPANMCFPVLSLNYILYLLKYQNLPK
jgi:hypothetical protein